MEQGAESRCGRHRIGRAGTRSEEIEREERKPFMKECLEEVLNKPRENLEIEEEPQKEREIDSECEIDREVDRGRDHSH